MHEASCIFRVGTDRDGGFAGGPPRYPARGLPQASLHLLRNRHRGIGFLDEAGDSLAME
jgi:hypothetical protein